ncbi:MAG: hypothetical protein OEZ39_19365 [Gammaproteobacteria bacterium]|nr:hypothetical protein [Gammaproteobacteria bacterium]MDH5654025.1 hypothetical protein [Gammaproteobacteria bacterium]
MSSCDPFKVEFSGSAEQLFEKLKKLVEDNKGTISGNASEGTVTIPIKVVGTISGTYKISGQICTIHITKKPLLLPCSTIETFIKDNIPKA